jgi:type II secretory pathway component PulJ
VALVLLALVALAAVAVLAGVRSVGGAGTQTKRLETTTQASSVQIGNDCGQVTVREGSQGVVRTEARITTLWRTPTVTSREVGDSVVVDVQCPPFSGGVRLAVEVPPAAAIQARSSAGGVQVDGVSGPLTLESSAGSVQGEDLASAQVQAQSSAGSVTLRWSDDADPQSIDATSSAGSVTVQLPDNPSTAYRVDADSSAGSTQVEVRTDPSATRTVRAQSSAGSVLVTYR